MSRAELAGLVSDDHPVSMLGFFFDGEFTDDDAEALRDALLRVGDREWAIEPPEFVDYMDNANGDAVRVVGGCLALFEALPPWGERLDERADLANLEDVELLVSMLSELARRRHLEFALELGGRSVGWIGADSGNMLQEGLIGPWASRLRGE